MLEDEAIGNLLRGSCNASVRRQNSPSSRALFTGIYEHHAGFTAALTNCRSVVSPGRVRKRRLSIRFLTITERESRSAIIATHKLIVLGEPVICQSITPSGAL